MPDPDESPSRIAVYNHLADSERAKVSAFRQQVLAMWKAPIGTDARRVLLEVENDYDWSTATETTPPRLKQRTVTAPTNDELGALLLRVRPFLQQGEDIDCNYLVVRKLISDHFHQAGITHFKDWFQEAKQASSIRGLLALGLGVTGQELLDLWLYGEIFHKKATKRQKFLQLQQAHGEDRVRACLMIALSAFQTQVIELHQFIESNTDIYKGLDRGS